MKSHGYRMYMLNTKQYLDRSLLRLALFADVPRIKTPKQCQQALSKINKSLFFVEQYTVLKRYAEGEQR